MKTRLRPQSGKSASHGSAVIVVIGLIAILLIYSMGNVRTLDHLGKELRFIEQAHLRAWAGTHVTAGETTIDSEPGATAAETTQ